MSDWITGGHALYIGALAALGSLGFLPVVRAIAWNIYLKRLRVPLVDRQRFALKAACRHLGVDPQPDAPESADLLSPTLGLPGQPDENGP